MKNLLLFTLTTILFACNVYSQEFPKDSSFINPGSFNTIENMLFKLEEFEFYRDKFHSDISITLDEDNSTIKLRTEMIIRQSMKNDFLQTDNHLYFLSPLYKKHLEDSKFNPVRYVLGMAQLGAVGYLAYRHIKKYGFID